VKSKDCFIWYLGGDKWEPVTGTGCAHFVAHEKNIRAPGRVEHCLEGFLVRVVDLLPGLTEVKELRDVKPGDIYITPDRGTACTGLLVYWTAEEHILNSKETNLIRE